MKSVPLSTPLPLFYVGPGLHEGPLPCIIYLALSAEETLLVDPFNQPVAYLSSAPVRIFSVDLPFHGSGQLATEAMQHWQESFEQGKDILSPFLDQLEETLKILFAQTHTTQVGVMGLSRGGFLAAHLAARLNHISALMAYAPLTELGICKEFRDLQDSPDIQNLSLNRLTQTLSHKKVRAHIGNRDIRVSTDACYQWIHSLTEAAFEKNIRSPQIELVISPSIGHMGHGTSKGSFEEGALWLAKQLEVAPL